MKKKTVAVISNDHAWTYNLRREILQSLLDNGYRVTVIVGYGKKIDDLKAIGCDFVDIPLERHGTNPFHELTLVRKYKKALRELKPDVALTYTLKPNIYGGWVCGKEKIPFVANITGLGTAVENESFMQKVLIKMLKVGLKRASMVFFQNTENQAFLVNKKVVVGRHDLLPGSGVNTSYFSLLPYPEGDTVEFVFISRIMKEKGIDQYLEAAEIIRKKYPYTRFHICGFCEEAYEKRIAELSDNGTIIYHGMVDDVREVLNKVHCTIHPTYYPEGLSNVLLESSACGRPIITTNRSGCREVIDDGVNGYIVMEKNTDDLVEKIEKFLALSNEQRKEMGKMAREKVVNEFDRNIVVKKYLEVIEELTSKNQ